MPTAMTSDGFSSVRASDYHGKKVNLGNGAFYIPSMAKCHRERIPMISKIYNPVTAYTNSKGLKIRAVLDDSPAQHIGIKEGDELVYFNYTWPQGSAKKVSETLKRLGKNANGYIAVRRGTDILGGYIKTYENYKKNPAIGLIFNEKKAKAYKVKLAKEKMAAQQVKSVSPVLPPKAPSTYNREDERAKLRAKTQDAKKVKVETREAKDAASEVAASTIVATSPESDNHFMSKAREELASINRLVEDLNGADAYMKARALKIELERSMHNQLRTVGDKVSDYLDKRGKENEIDVPSVEGQGKVSGLSRLGKIVAGGLAIGAAVLVVFLF